MESCGHRVTITSFCFCFSCNWICGWDIALNSMEFWKFIISLFNSNLSSTFILRENRNWSQVLDSKLTIYGQDRWQLIIISFNSDVFFLLVIVLKLKLRNTKSVKKRQAIAILEKGSPLAALTVADLLEDSIEIRVRGQAQHCGSPGNVLIIKNLFCPGLKQDLKYYFQMITSRLYHFIWKSFQGALLDCRVRNIIPYLRIVDIWLHKSW